MSKSPSRGDTTWVVVADESIARFLELPDQGNLKEIETLEDADARSAGAELRDDAQGRRAPSVSGGVGGAPTLGVGMVTASAGESELHKEAVTFARQVADRLREHHRQHRFTLLRLVAAPRFLGLLRRRLDPALLNALTADLDKDLTHTSAAELTRRLFPEHDGPRRHLDPQSATEARTGNKDILH
jgi:protein required for attachment to host cells